MPANNYSFSISPSFRVRILYPGLRLPQWVNCVHVLVQHGGGGTTVDLFPGYGLAAVREHVVVVVFFGVLFVVLAIVPRVVLWVIGEASVWGYVRLIQVECMCWVSTASVASVGWLAHRVVVALLVVRVPAPSSRVGLARWPQLYLLDHAHVGYLLAGLRLLLVLSLVLLIPPLQESFLQRYPMIDINILQQQLNSLYLGLLLKVVHCRSGLQLSKRRNQKRLKLTGQRRAHRCQTFFNAFGFQLLVLPLVKCSWQFVN